MAEGSANSGNPAGPQVSRSAPQPLKRRKRDLTTDKVIDAAVDLVVENGVEALSLRLLAERMGVSATALYRHVDSKKELITLIARRVTEAHFAGLTVPQEFGWQDVLRWMTRLRLDLVRHHPEVARFGALLFATDLNMGAGDRIVSSLNAHGMSDEQVTQIMWIVGLALDAALEQDARTAAPDHIAHEHPRFSAANLRIIRTSNGLSVWPVQTS